MDATLTFAQWLKNRRQALDLTQAGLAEAIGCAPVTIRSMEAGRRRPSQQVAELLAVALYISPDERPAFIQWARGMGAAPSSALSSPSLQAASSSGSNMPALPVPPTPLIGRDREGAQVRASLWRASTRLVTLTGPPGIGKTRLALAVALDLQQDFSEGVCFVHLAPVTDPQLVAGTIARSLGVHIAPAETEAEAVMRYLRSKQQLLILDNFEQVVEAATLVADLLAVCPRVKVLVTSRRQLHLRGEKEIAVPPLALPRPNASVSPREIAHVEAVALFVERAQDARSEFALTERNARVVADICLRLDGLPLAIELAAAKVKLLSLADLLAGLDDSLHLLTGGARDLPGRHQTLLNAIQSSYELLNPRLQRIFRRLGIFLTPFDRQGAEIVAGAGLDDISALVDASMVQRQLSAQGADVESRQTRYDMLATLREFAVQELTVRGEMEEARRKHTEYFSRMALQARSELRGGDQALWLEKLTGALADIRAALAWSIERNSAAPAMLIAGSLWSFWYTVGYFTEGRQWLERALALPDVASPEVRALALHAAGTLAWLQGDLAQGEKLLNDALALRREIGDKVELCHTVNNLGLVRQARGDGQAALELFTEAVDLRRETGDLHGLAATLGNLAMIEYMRCEYDHGLAHLQQGLALRRQLGDKNGEVATLNDMAAMATGQGDYLRAQQFAKEALLLARVLGDKLGAAYSLGCGAVATLTLGDHEAALQMFTEALALFDQAGNRQGIAETLEHLAAIASIRGRPERAARLFAAADAIRDSIGVPRDPPAVPEYKRSLAAARQQIDDATWKSAWREGLVMGSEQAVVYALERLEQE